MVPALHNLCNLNGLLITIVTIAAIAINKFPATAFFLKCYWSLQYSSKSLWMPPPHTLSAPSQPTCISRKSPGCFMSSWGHLSKLVTQAAKTADVDRTYWSSSESQNVSSAALLTSRVENNKSQPIYRCLCTKSSLFMRKKIRFGLCTMCVLYIYIYIYKNLIGTTVWFTVIFKHV